MRALAGCLGVNGERIPCMFEESPISVRWIKTWNQSKICRVHILSEMHYKYHARFCNSCSCCGRLECFLSVYTIDIHSAKVVHAFIPTSTVKNELYSITKCTFVKAKWMQIIISFAICSKAIHEWSLKPHLFHAKMQNMSKNSTMMLATKCIMSGIVVPTKVTWIA